MTDNGIRAATVLQAIATPPPGPCECVSVCVRMLAPNSWQKGLRIENKIERTAVSCPKFTTIFEDTRFIAIGMQTPPFFDSLSLFLRRIIIFFIFCVFHPI